MRQEDRDEIWHLARVTPLQALMASLSHCSYSRAVLLDGRVVAIFGVGGEKGKVGVPWMLASPLLVKIRKAFLRESQAFLEEMSKDFIVLQNVAWIKNKEHIRWLKWLGFEFIPAEPRGPDGELYTEFYKVN